MAVSKQELSKNSFLGSMELAIFMRQGVERFHADFKTMLLSFLVSLILLPFTFISLYVSHPMQEEIAHLEFSQVALMYFLKGLLTLPIKLLILYGFAKGFDRLENLYLTITTLNWSMIFPTLLFMPLVLSLHMGLHSWDEIYVLNIVFALYGYALIAFILTFAFRIPWEMAGFLAICFMAINETAFDILYWFAGSP